MGAALIPLAWLGRGSSAALPQPIAEGPAIEASQHNALDSASRIGANLGAVRYCYRNYGADTIVRTRFKALEKLANEALLNLSADNQQRAERQRALVEASGQFDGKPLTLSQCEAVRKGFLDHYR